MKIIIKTKNLELTPALQKFTESKISSAKKFIDILKQDTPEKGKTLAEIFVEIGKETKHHRKGEIFIVKTKIVLPGKSLLIMAKSDDLHKAIVAAKDELKVEIGKYKLKKIEKIRRKQKKQKEKIKS